MPDRVDSAVEYLHFISPLAQGHVYDLRDYGVVVNYQDLLAHRTLGLRETLSPVVKLYLRLRDQFMYDEEEKRANAVEEQYGQQPEASVASQYPLPGQSAERERHHSPVDQAKKDDSKNCLASHGVYLLRLFVQYHCPVEGVRKA
jgi:hypothetical protein